VIKMMTLDY